MKKSTVHGSHHRRPVMRTVAPAIVVLVGTMVAPVLVPSVAGASQVTIGTGFSCPYGVTVDQHGIVYVADASAGTVQKVLPDGTQVPIGSGYDIPQAVAVDPSGTVFVADTFNNRVEEITPAGVQTTLAADLPKPTGIALDGAGNLLVAVPPQGRIVEIAPGGTETTVASGFQAPTGVAVDGTGNLFVADTNAAAVYRIAPDGVRTTVGSGYLHPYELTADAAGDVFVADYGTNQVDEVTAGGVQTTVGSGFSGPSDVAVDGLGDVFVADAQNRQVVEVNAPRLTPDAPPRLTSSPGLGSARVMFTAPPDNGSPITSYTVTARDVSGSAADVVVSGPSSPIVVTGLTDGHAYTFSVAATNAHGTGPSSYDIGPMVVGYQIQQSALQPPTARVGALYYVALTTALGSGRTTWRLSGGGLPPGLHLGSRTGTISGTVPLTRHNPVSASYSFTVTAVDQARPARHATSETYVLTVTR